MLARKVRLYRMKAKLSIIECKRRTGISYERLHRIETCISNITVEEAEYLAKFFNTTTEEITKIIDIDIIRKNKFEYVVNRENVPEDEIEEHFEKIRAINNERRKQYEIKKINEVRESNKVTESFKCLNQACLLNKNCMCNNPVVIRGAAPCYGKDKIQGKPKKRELDYSLTKSCFMTYNVSKEEKEERKKYIQKYI